MEDEQLSLAVEQPTPAPLPTLPLLESEKPLNTTTTPEPKADKGPSLRDSLEAGIKGLRDRARDPATGKFAPVEKAPTPNGLDPSQPQPIAPAKIERPADMPKAWGADKASLWAAMTPEQRAYVTERETQADQLHQNYGGLKRWHETALENGTTLPEVLDRMHAVETKMYESPPDGLIAAMQAVGLDHGSAVKTLVSALTKLGVNPNGAQVPQGQQQQQPQQQFRDPRVDQLLEAQRNEKLRAAQEQVTKFRTDPANKYFEEVADDIMREIGFEKAQGRQPDLKQIYERVIWANPGTRQKILAEQSAQQAQAQTQVRTQELTKARSASGSVAGTLPAAEGRKADRPASLRDDLTSRVRTMLAGRV
jgi:hypothetical protein